MKLELEPRITGSYIHIFSKPVSSKRLDDAVSIEQGAFGEHSLILRSPTHVLSIISFKYSWKPTV